MAYTSGTASNYIDLLAVMTTFAAANGWVVLEQSATQVFLKGTGNAGLDEIYCGAVTYADSGNNRYNWQLVGSWGWRSGRVASAQPRSASSFAYLWNAAIPYWMVCNGRRIIVCAKIGTTYQMIYLGFLTVPATDAQYPYPLFIGGSGDVATKNTSDSIQSFWNGSTSSYGRLSLPGGYWGYTGYSSGDYTANQSLSVMTFNEANRSVMFTAPDGTYLLEPFYVTACGAANTYGMFEGLFRVTGYNNTAENIITVGGVNYMVFPDGSRTGYGDFCAMRLN